MLRRKTTTPGMRKPLVYIPLHLPGSRHTEQHPWHVPAQHTSCWHCKTSSASERDNSALPALREGSQQHPAAAHSSSLRTFCTPSTASSKSKHRDTNYPQSSSWSCCFLRLVMLTSSSEHRAAQHGCYGQRQLSSPELRANNFQISASYQWRCKNKAALWIKALLSGKACQVTWNNSPFMPTPLLHPSERKLFSFMLV